MDIITGRCECKRIAFEITGPITDFSHCHCSQCRRLHGAAFASFAGVDASKFRYVTDTSDLRAYESSDDHRRLFCGNCGSNIMVQIDAYPDQFYIAMGSIDGEVDLPEAYHIYVGSKAPWHEILDSGEQYVEDADD